jgi:prophage regulatory protein
MMQSGRNERGRKLTSTEFEALACALYRLFGAIPGPAKGSKANRQPLPEDDTMLSMKDVVRLTGLSTSTIKRMVSTGLFPKPLRPSPRRIGWPASEVRVWTESLDQLRQRDRRY